MNPHPPATHHPADGCSPLTVAAIQTAPVFGDTSRNLNRQAELVAAAAVEGAGLVVLPELGTTGYAFRSRREAFDLSETVGQGEACRLWADLCATHGIYLCAGLCERDQGRLYNSAVLMGPDGLVGRYRKTHLWEEEKLFFEPGDTGLPIFHLPFGRVGVMICYDAWFPEVPAILARQGADLICDPTAWPHIPDNPVFDRPLEPQVHLAIAHVHQVFVACANRTGREHGVSFRGLSCIAGPAGFEAGPGSADREEIVPATIDLSAARCKQWGRNSGTLSDLRRDIYDPMASYSPHRWALAQRQGVAAEQLTLSASSQRGKREERFNWSEPIPSRETP